MNYIFKELKFLEFLAISVIGVSLLIARHYWFGSLSLALGLIILLWKKCFLLLSFLMISLGVILSLEFIGDSNKSISRVTIVKKCTLNMCVVENNNSKYLMSNKYDLTESDILEGKYQVRAIDSEYAYSENVKEELFVSKLFSVSKHDSFREKIFGVFKYNEAKPFLKWMIFGIPNEMVEKLKSRFIDMGIIHLIVISGFHVGIIFMILSKIFKKNIFIPLMITGIYILLLQFSISSTRSYSLILLSVLNKKYNWKLRPITCLSVLVIIFLTINSHTILSLSFLLSFSTTYWVLRLQNKKNGILNRIGTLFLIYLSTIPWIISINGKLNILSFLYTILLTPVIAFIYVICLSTFYIGYLSKIHLLFWIVLDKISEISRINTYIYVYSLNGIFLFFWYISLWLMSVNRNWYKILVPICLIMLVFKILLNMF